MPDQPITAEHFTDPLSVRCWATQPTIRHFRYDFREVQWVPRLTVLFPDTTDPDLLPAGIDDRDDLDEYWTDLLEGTGMPADGDLWSTDPPDSSRDLCATVAVVRERDPAAALDVLRRFREYAFVRGWLPTDHGELAAVAADATDLDPEPIVRALESGRGDELLEADLDRGLAIARSIAADDRHDAELLPLDPRTSRDLDAFEGVEPDGDDQTSERSQDDSEDERSEDDPAGEDTADVTEPPEPSTLAPPTVWMNQDGDGVPVSTEDGHSGLASAARMFDARAGDTAVDPVKQSTNAMSGYVAQRELVEQITSEDHAGNITEYLEYYGSAFVVEIATGVQCTDRTARRELALLRDKGVVEQLSADAWKLVE